MKHPESDLQDLDPMEKQLIDRSGNASVVRRRVRYSLVLSSLLVVAVAWLAFYAKSPEALGIVFVVYIVGKAFQTWAQGQAILAYKGLVHKLWTRVSDDQYSNDPGTG